MRSFKAGTVTKEILKYTMKIERLQGYVYREPSFTNHLTLKGGKVAVVPMRLAFMVKMIGQMIICKRCKE